MTQEILSGVPLFHLELVRERSIPFVNGSETSFAARAAEILHNLLDRSPVEQMIVMHVNYLGELCGAEKVGTGTVSSVGTRSPELFRSAIAGCVDKIVLAHCHPLGDPTPSTADIMFTLNAVDVGAFLQINIVDHIVVSPRGTHFSIFDNQDKLAGLMQKEMAMTGHSLSFDQRLLVEEAVRSLKPKPIGTKLFDW